MNDKLVKNAWIILFVYIFLVPFYYMRAGYGFSGLQIAVKYFPFFMIVFISLYCINHIKSITPSRLIIPKRNLIIYFLTGFFIFWQFATLTVNGFVLSDLYKLIYYSLTGVWISVIVVYQRFTPQGIFFFLSTLTVLASLISLHGLFVVVFRFDPLYELPMPFIPYDVMYGDAWYNRQWIDRPMFTLGNPNYAGGLLSITLPIALGVARIEKSKVKKIIFKLIFLSIILGVIATYSRGAFVASISVLILYLILLSVFSEDSRVVHTSVLSYSLFAVAIFIFANVFNGAGPLIRAYDRFLSLSNVFQTESHRWEQYAVVAQMVYENPFTGIGFGRYTSYSGTYYSEKILSYLSRTAENMYLMILGETGILGLITFLLVLYFTFKKLFVALRSTNERDLVISLISSLFGAFVSMWTWDGLNQPTFRITFWFIIGISWLVGDRIISDKERIETGE